MSHPVPANSLPSQTQAIPALVLPPHFLALQEIEMRSRRCAQLMQQIESLNRQNTDLLRRIKIEELIYKIQILEKELAHLNQEEQSQTIIRQLQQENERLRQQGQRPTQRINVQYGQVIVLFNQR